MNVKALLCVAVLGCGLQVAVSIADEATGQPVSSVAQSRIDVAMISGAPSFSGVPGITNIALYSGAGILLSDTVPAATALKVVPIHTAEVTRKHGRIYLGRSIVRSGWRFVDLQKQAASDVEFLAERDKGSVPPPAPAPEPAD